MGSIGFDELLIVVLVAIIAFGRDLPSVARKVGGWYSKFRRHVSDIKDELQRHIPEEPDVDLPPPNLDAYDAPAAPPPDRPVPTRAPTSPAPPESGSTPPSSPPADAGEAAPPAAAR